MNRFDEWDKLERKFKKWRRKYGLWEWPPDDMLINEYAVKQITFVQLKHIRYWQSNHILPPFAWELFWKSGDVRRFFARRDDEDWAWIMPQEIRMSALSREVELSERLVRKIFRLTYQHERLSKCTPTLQNSATA